MIRGIKFALTLLLAAVFYGVTAQIPGMPGGEFVIEINNVTGVWNKTGPPIDGITYIYPNVSTYNDSAGIFIFPSALINRNLYSIDVTNDGIVGNPLLNGLGAVEYDNNAKILYGIVQDNANNRLDFVSVNAGTGVQQKIGNGIPGSGLYQGFSTFDKANHKFILIGPPVNLYSIDAADGSIISSPGLVLAPGESIVSLSFDNSSGILYGLLQNDGGYNLVTINQTDGTHMKIGPGTSFGIGSGNAAIDEANQQYVYLYPDPAGYQVTTIDLATGVVLHNVTLNPTPKTTFDNFYSLEYDPIRKKFFSIHWESFPIITPVPLLVTNVTVDATDPEAGQLTVTWRSPVAASAADFPAPFSYVLFRSENTAAKGSFMAVNPGLLTDTTYTDTNLNTTYANIYYYRIASYASNGHFYDSSAIASSVSLQVKPLSNAMQLTWNANVPWSNKSSLYPRHLIYRGRAASTIKEMTLIDSVDVTHESQFIYLDSGKNNPLQFGKSYCYAVMTRGAYTNPIMQAPLENFSEISCATLVDNTRPCAPTLAMTSIDCDTYAVCPNDPAGAGSYQNIIRWTPNIGKGCGTSLAGYNVYASSDNGFVLIAQAVRDTFFVHSNLQSIALCYKVSALDMAGHESTLSDPVCFDNCPMYSLPNVFTPNGDQCNDRFSAFSLRDVDTNGATPCGSLGSDELNMRKGNCARFVNNVVFKAYNRWGKEVYEYRSGGGNSIYIDWDGKSNTGNELDAGNYYYVANVDFDVIDLAKKSRTLKGWVVIVK